MKTAELRAALDDLAGPAPHPTPEVRAAVAGRVRRARRRITAALSVAAIVVVIAGLGIAQSAALDAPSTGDVVTAAPARCTKLPPRVPRGQVPASVRRWSGSAPVVGGGSLWTVRRLLKQTPVHDGSVWRFKIGWLVVPLGPGTPAPILTARQVGGPGRASGSVDRATDATGTWFASTIELTGPGTCWEITAKQGRDTIRFRRSLGSG